MVISSTTITSEYILPVLINGAGKTPVEKLDSVVKQDEHGICVDLGETKARHEEGLAVCKVETHVEDGDHS